MANPRILAVDVGTGTQDILVFEAGTVVENSVQLVMPSPTMLMAERVREATAAGIDLLLTGVTMGGGPVHWAVESHLKGGLKVYATLEAAATFDDDLSRVAAMGVSIVDRSVALRLSGVRRLELRDFYFDAIVDALAAFGVSGDFDAVAVAVFDHGEAPPGYSDRRFRFDYLKRQVESGAGLERFGFLAADIPDRMTRMMAVAESCALKQPLFVMDTGAAAALGALDDPRVRGVDHLLLANIGNFHTLAFLLDRGRIRGLFEHHTGELTKSELESYLDRLAEGRIRNVDVFNDMGHGALELEPVPWKPEVLALTGPRRGMLDGARRQPYLAVPHGNMMIAGCFGLLRGLAAHLPEFAGPINQVLGPPAYRA